MNRQKIVLFMQAMSRLARAAQGLSPKRAKFQITSTDPVVAPGQVFPGKSRPSLWFSQAHPILGRRRH